jgi:hypothetical protein
MTERAQDRPIGRQTRRRVRIPAPMTTSESTDALTSLAPMLTGTPGDWTATPGQAATPSRRELVRFSL